MANVHAFKQEQGTVQTTNPATEQVIAEYTLMSDAQVQDKINAAHKAFLSWREKSLEERGKIIRNIGKVLEDNKEELAKLMSEEMGKPVQLGLGEMDRCIKICHYTADEDYKNLLDEERDLADGKKGIISYEPTGIVFGIQPWNFPLYQVVRYTIPNLMAGNAVFLKHAQNVWGMAKRFQELVEEAGLPENVFTALFIDHDQAEDVIAHKYVRGLSLTGSAKAGKTVAQVAAKYLKKCVLELGGSDPYIVLEDADIEKAVQTCVTGRVANTGQTCVNAKRFIILDKIYDAFKEQYIAAMKDVSYGDPLQEETQMGPMARKDLRENLHDQVTESIKKGAKPLLGCEMPEGTGYFYPASILEDPQPGSPAYDDELFGPVACLFRAKDEDDAIRIANDHRYGLGGGVISGDEQRAIDLARRIDTGMVSVNGFYGSQANLPFGGVKESGYGREHGGFGIREFVNIKSIYVGDQQD